MSKITTNFHIMLVIHWTYINRLNMLSMMFILSMFYYRQRGKTEAIIYSVWLMERGTLRQLCPDSEAESPATHKPFLHQTESSYIDERRVFLTVYYYLFPFQVPHKIIAVNRDFSFECGRERDVIRRLWEEFCEWCGGSSGPGSILAFFHFLTLFLHTHWRYLL